MKTFMFDVKYECHVHVKIEAESIEEAKDKLNDSIYIDDYADVVNILTRKIEILKEMHYD